MKPLEPTFVAKLFPELHRELLLLLQSLADSDWDRPTRAGTWTVHDVAAHLLDGDIRKLSFHRDRRPLIAPGRPISNHADLVAFLDSLNAEWLRAARRIGPRLLCEFLAVTGPQVSDFVAGLDPFAPSVFPVAWAGESESQNWLDTGREYTERWHHQQQIREAVGAPLLTEPHWLRPVLEISIRALPFAYRDVLASEGDAVTVSVTGPSGGVWSVVRSAASWALFDGSPTSPAARVTLDEETAWRLFLKAATAEEIRARSVFEGNPILAEAFLESRAVMA